MGDFVILCWILDYGFSVADAWLYSFFTCIKSCRDMAACIFLETDSNGQGDIWLNYTRDHVINWKHFSALQAICAGNSPVTGEFPSKRPVTRGFDVFFDLRLNKRLNKQSWGWWFETPSRSLWRHCNANGKG